VLVLAGGIFGKHVPCLRSTRLGMWIIRSLVEQIGGELRIGRGDDNQGTRFTVLFWNQRSTMKIRRRASTNSD